MSCPNCDHTMQALTTGARAWYWCPACGTVRQRGNHYADETPKIAPAELYRGLQCVHLFSNVALNQAVLVMMGELQRRGIEPTREPLDDPLGRG